MLRALQDELTFGAVSRRELPVSTHLPYTRHVDDWIVRTKTGLLMNFIKLEGFSFQTADWSEINVRMLGRNDLVRTLQVGRAQILLLDGSTLNVGARSEIKILKHDPQAQQTEIELTLGQVQADVRKITAAGGKFEIHTKSAVIGTIDTSFVASADDKQTIVCGRTGITTVKSSDPKNPKVVKLHRKECTKVIFGGVPLDPVFNPAQFASLASQTGVGTVGGLAPAAAAGIAGGAAGGGAAVAAVVLATAGTTSPTAP